MEIKSLRLKIDKVDKIIVKNLIKRFDIAKKIGKIKKENSIKISDIKREKEVFSNIKRISGDYAKNMIKIYKIIIKETKRIEK